MRTEAQRKAFLKLRPDSRQDGIAETYQDERYAGQVVADWALGVKGRYLYSFVSRIDGEVWHIMSIDAVRPGRGFQLGSVISRKEIVCVEATPAR